MFEYSDSKCSDSENEGFHTTGVMLGNIGSLAKEFFVNHTCNNAKYSSESLSFCKGIFIIVNVDWHFAIMKSSCINLIDKFARIFHTIHGELDFIKNVHTKHAVSVVTIREIDAGYCSCKDTSSPENETTKKWNVRFCFYDKP